MSTVRTVFVQFHGCRESDKVLDEESWVVDLSKDKRHLHRFKDVDKRVFLDGTIHGTTDSGLVTDGHFTDSFSTGCHDLGRDKVWRNNVQTFE